MLVGTVVIACVGGGSGDLAAAPTAVVDPTATHGHDAAIERLDAIDAAVASWRGATDLATAHAGAEAVRNLVVGPTGPGYGDADGDGSIGGASAVGLLPGLAGEPGLVSDSGASPCVAADVLGGSWADPRARWATLQTAIDGWSAAQNTFPALPSHPQRIVGWATLALASDDLRSAIEYAGHASIHSTVTRQALADCDS